MSETEAAPVGGSTGPEGLSVGRIRLGTIAEIVGDEQRTITTVDGHEILTLAVGTDIYAVGNMCTHRRFWLDQGEVFPESREIACPVHQGRFSLRTGAATMSPCELPVPTYPVIVADGVIYTEIASVDPDPPPSRSS